MHQRAVRQSCDRFAVGKSKGSEGNVFGHESDDFNFTFRGSRRKRRCVSIFETSPPLLPLFPLRTLDDPENVLSEQKPVGMEFLRRLGEAG